MKVIVVGAGISGLAAAHALARGGAEVTVLDARDRIGGRIKSLTVNGCIVEAGANFITSAYTVIPRLAGQAGLAFRHVNHHAAIVLPNGTHRVRVDRPWSAVTSGLLPAGAALRALPGLARHGRLAGGRGSVDPLAWIDIDEHTASVWAATLGLQVLAERVWSPSFHGLYFQNIADSGAPVVAAMAAHGVRQRTWTCAGGLSTLIKTLAATLDVRTRVKVESVDERGDGVCVHTSGGPLRADAAILAVPGPALPLLRELRDDEAPLARTSYSAGLLAAVGINRRLAPDELDGAYGFLIAPGLGLLAAICVASRAGHAGPDRDVVTCMFTDAMARTLSSRSDGEILDAARQRLAELAPTLAGAFIAEPGANHVERISHAMPSSPPGRVAAIARYRGAAAGRRILIAGDAIAWPWTDSAAAAGEWAARTLLLGRATG